MYKLLSLVFSLLILSCSTNLQQLGYVEKEDFYEEIPFNFQENLIIMDVEIEGEIYKLALDTGADYNVFDISLLDKFNYKKKGEIEIQSSTSKVDGILSVVVPEITIGSIDFKNTAAVFLDFSGIKRLIGCSEIDGLIGNNLMRKAGWKIDYENKIVSITDDMSQFDISPSAIPYTMNAESYGGIKIPVTIGNKTNQFTIDTGYTGFVKTNDKEILQDYPYITRSGITGANASGVEKNEDYLALVDVFTIADISIEKRTISVKENTLNLVGNSFYKHFDIYIDWNKDLFILDPVQQIEEKDLHVFEVNISPNYSSNTIEIASTYTQGQLHNVFSPGTQVIEINGIETSNFTTEELCEFWSTSSDDFNDKESLQIKALMPNDEIKTYIINRLP